MALYKNNVNKKARELLGKNCKEIADFLHLNVSPERIETRCKEIKQRQDNNLAWRRKYLERNLEKSRKYKRE